MPKPEDRLQPYRVFLAETTAINDLYWKTRYTYGRMGEVLAERAQGAADPLVHALWPATVEGERRQITVSLSDYRTSLDENLAALRRTSVLYTCSAFENALALYFVLCCLYRPQLVFPTWAHGACPALAGDRTRLDDLRKLAIEAAGTQSSVQSGAAFNKQKLKGKYSRRLEGFNTYFGAGLRVTALPSTLDAHQLTRHHIAHGQGLTGADDPTAPAAEMLARRIAISEAEWKVLLADFVTTVEALDRAVRTRVVTDHGVALAVAHALEGQAPRAFTVGSLRAHVATTWRMILTNDEIVAALRVLGRSTTSERAVARRTIL